MSFILRILQLYIRFQEARRRQRIDNAANPTGQHLFEWMNFPLLELLVRGFLAFHALSNTSERGSIRLTRVILSTISSPQQMVQEEAIVEQTLRPVRASRLYPLIQQLVLSRKGQR